MNVFYFGPSFSHQVLHTRHLWGSVCMHYIVIALLSCKMGVASSSDSSKRLTFIQ